VIDFIHVLEYLWKAAWCFHAPRDPAMEDWVIAQALDILHGRAADVIARIARLARDHPPKPGGEHAKIIRKTLSYLQNKQAWMDYPRALAEGWPIATGVIEGACRHLVQDRMGITGARWGLEGAQAILWLRAINAKRRHQRPTGTTTSARKRQRNPPQPLQRQPRPRRLNPHSRRATPCPQPCRWSSLELHKTWQPCRMNRPPAWHQESQQRTGNPAAPRRGSVKRVASAVGEGAVSNSAGAPAAWTPRREARDVPSYAILARTAETRPRHHRTLCVTCVHGLSTSKA